MANNTIVIVVFNNPVELQPIMALVIQCNRNVWINTECKKEKSGK